MDGVTGAIIEQVAVQAPAQRSERAERRPLRRRPGPDGRLLADPRSGGATLSLADLRPDEVYLNTKAGRELRVEAGDRVVVYAGATRFR